MGSSNKSVTFNINLHVAVLAIYLQLFELMHTDSKSRGNRCVIVGPRAWIQNFDTFSGVKQFFVHLKPFNNFVTLLNQ